MVRHSNDVEPDMDVGTYLNRSDIQGKTALHQAAISNNEAVLEGLKGHASIGLDAFNARGQIVNCRAGDR